MARARDRERGGAVRADRRARPPRAPRGHRTRAQRRPLTLAADCPPPLRSAMYDAAGYSVRTQAMGNFLMSKPLADGAAAAAGGTAAKAAAAAP